LSQFLLVVRNTTMSLSANGGIRSLLRLAQDFGASGRL